MTSAPTTPLVAGYRIEELAARGGMGVVYRATQLALGRPVALKLISPEFADDPQFRERFQRESRLRSLVNGKPVRRRQRLHDGDTVRVGNTLLLFRDPGEADVRSTTPTGERERIVALSDLQQQVLIALCRPFKASTSFVTPATNEEIASEVFLSVDAVKKHMRVLFEKFVSEHEL